MDSGFSRFEIVTTSAAFYFCLGFVCVFLEAPEIERQLTVAARDEVVKSELLWVGVEADGQQVKLSGAAIDEDSKLRAGVAAVAVSGVTRVINEIEVVGDQALCQAALNAKLTAQQIDFAVGRTELPEESFSLLEDLANVAAQCLPALEIAVHTTSKGDAEVNRKLSQRRAESVAKYLVRAGVPANRLHAQGHGEAQPLYYVASGADERNQRIEIRVKGRAA